MLQKLTIRGYGEKIDTQLEIATNTSTCPSLTHITLIDRKYFEVNKDFIVAPHIKLTVYGTQNAYHYTARIEVISGIVVCSYSQGNKFYMSTTLQNLPQTTKQLLLVVPSRYIMFPPNLTHLILPYHYRQLITELPSTLLHFSVGLGFKGPLPKLPPNLTHLTLSVDYSLPHILLPPKLTHFTLLARYYNYAISFPPSITHLTVYSSVDQLPPKLRSLTIITTKKLPALPATLKKLQILEPYKYKLDLPQLLSTLVISYPYEFVHMIPQTVCLTFIYPKSEQ